SFRRYFRSSWQGHSYIAVDAPPQHENSSAFVRVCRMLRAAGVRAPEIFASDLERGFLLLEDFGDSQLLPKLSRLQSDGESQRAGAIYQSALQTLLLIQRSPEKERLDPYDRDQLRSEMQLFTDWFCKAFLELELSDSEHAVIDQAMHFLEEAALSQPTVMVHRDFHSRNLMLLDDSAVPALGVIDFQDAVHGPYSYDVVSLLRDCYLRWEPETVNLWALTYWQAARAEGLLADVSEAQFLRDFDLMGLQRHLKVMGIFCRLSLRDNKSRYLADIPLVIQYFLEVSRRYPELGDFVEWFNRRALPVANQRLPKSVG
ncbi:MAG: aminoglycoside phosphotransferase family protein, partial [Pseudohongiellaceae bacterium]